jgi:histidinol-phosphate phosphatase family protein
MGRSNFRYLSCTKTLLQDVAFLHERGLRQISPRLGTSPDVPALPHDSIGPSATVLGRDSQPRRSDPRPGVLLDRDGTIIVDHGHVGSVDRVEFIDGAAEAIARLNRAGVPIAVVTNQAGVARGLYDISDVEEVHRYIADRLAEHGAHVDRFFYCPYHPDGSVPEFARTSDDRKPMPGMARAAAEALNLDLTSSWVVGDRMEDIGLAEAVGASAIHVGPDPCIRPGVQTLSDLSLAADFILERIAA